MTGLSISMDFSPKSQNTLKSDDVSLTTDQRLQLFMQETSGRALVMMESACYSQQDIAMDIVQEAYIALHQNYANKPTDEWYPLFYTILNNKLLDWKRKEARRSQRFGWLKLNPLSGIDEDSQTDLDIPDQNQLDPSEYLNQEFTSEEIHHAIQELPLRQQQAFMLRAWEGFDTAATAKIMGCSEGSVKTHYHRAIQTLKSALSHLND